MPYIIMQEVVIPSLDLSFLWIIAAIVIIGMAAEIYSASKDTKLRSKYYNICFVCGSRVEASRGICPYCNRRILFSSITKKPQR